MTCIKTLGIAAILGSWTLYAAPLEIFKDKVFGTPLFFSAVNETIQKNGQQEIIKLKYHKTIAWDPDCRYRKSQKECQLNDTMKTEADKLTQFAEELKQETQGAFNVTTTKNGKKIRDFGGIGQGMFLEELKSKVPGDWFGNFSGDMWISANHPLASNPFVISHPFSDILPFAELKLTGGGWVFVSNGSNTRKTADSLGFERVVLFGAPSMHGGRLDAWGTAIAAGGEKTLSALWNLEQFRGKWGYLIFDNAFNIKCSPNITCENLDKIKERRVLVSFNP